MKTSLDNNTLTIFLEGRIDTNNAPRVDAEITEAIDGASPENIVIDAANLDYISSAGLRVLMKLRKSAGRALPVINVSRDVYDIFDTTGFTELFDVKKALRIISVKGCEVIGSGGYGTVYRLNNETIIKVYEYGSAEMIDKERTMSKRAFVNGLPTAISYDMVKVGDKFGVVYEMLDAKTIAQIISSQPDRIEEVTRLCISQLKSFHTIEIADSAFANKKQPLYEMADSIEKFLTRNQAQKLRAFIDTIPERSTFIHGDYNMKNVMLKNDEIMLIDIGDAGVGHPVFDIAGLILSFLIMPKSVADPEMARGLMGFDPALGERVWGIACSEYFGTDDPAEIGRYTQMIMPYALLLMSYHALRRCDAKDDETRKLRVDRLVKGKLLPAADKALPLDF